MDKPCRAVLRAALSLLFILSLVVSCLGGRDALPLGSLCTSDDDCEEQLICTYGRCRSECSRNADCDEEQVCNVHSLDPLLMVCTFSDEGLGETGQCPDGLVRPEGEACLRPCSDGSDCGPNQECHIELQVCIEEQSAADGDADGDIDIDPSYVPRLVATQVSAGGSHTCAVVGEGSVYCWGSSEFGQLGYGNTDTIGDDEAPLDADPVPVGGPVTYISAGYEHTCALLEGGDVKCWGRNGPGFGTLGYASTEAIGMVDVPADHGTVRVGGVVDSISAGSYFNCVIVDGDHVKCWGIGQDGQLGYPAPIVDRWNRAIGDDEHPDSVDFVLVQQDGGGVLDVSSGANHTCARLHDGSVRCWGSNADGMLGYPNTGKIGDTEEPWTEGPVQLGEEVRQLTCGEAHNCAVLTTDQLRCWGVGTYGRLGYASTDRVGFDEHPSDVATVEVGGTVQHVEAGGAHTCALLSDGTFRCWGRGNYGQLGYGDTENVGDNEHPATRDPIELQGTLVQFSLGMSHTCAVMDDGGIHCWGLGEHGQLGYGRTENIGDDETPIEWGYVRL